MISGACRKPASTALRFGPEPDLVIILVITSLSCLGIVMYQILGDVCTYGKPVTLPRRYRHAGTFPTASTRGQSQDLDAIMILTALLAVVIFTLVTVLFIGRNKYKTESSLRDGMRADTNDCFESPSKHTPPLTSSDTIMRRREGDIRKNPFRVNLII